MIPVVSTLFTTGYKEMPLMKSSGHLRDIVAEGNDVSVQRIPRTKLIMTMGTSAMCHARSAPNDCAAAHSFMMSWKSNVQK